MGKLTLWNNCWSLAALPRFAAATNKNIQERRQVQKKKKKKTPKKALKRQ